MTRDLETGGGRIANGRRHLWMNGCDSFGGRRLISGDKVTGGDAFHHGGTETQRKSPIVLIFLLPCSVPPRRRGQTKKFIWNALRAVPKSFPPLSEFASTKGIDCQKLWRYDVLTVTKIVNNGAWDGHVCFPQNGELRAGVRHFSFLFLLLILARSCLCKWSSLGERRSCPLVFGAFSGEPAQRASDSGANINAPGSYINSSLADLLVKFEGSSLNVEHGGVAAATSKGLATDAPAMCMSLPRPVCGLNST